MQFDEGLQTFVVSSAAFKKQSDGSISVDLEEALKNDGLNFDAVYPGSIKRVVGLVAHTVGRLETAGLSVIHKPVNGNDYHGEARGNASKTERVKLADTCEVIREIDQAEAEKQKRLDEEAKAAALRSNEI